MRESSPNKTVPTNWKTRILKREFEIVLGKMLQANQSHEGETEEFYLRSANVQWDRVDISDIKTMWFSPTEKRELLLRNGDLVVNEGGDVGRCAIWRDEIPECYIQNAINRVRARTTASTRFLYYWLNNLKQAGFLDAIVSRITIAHLTAEKLERIPWPDVPAFEQQCIASYLDASCAAIDAAVTAKRKQLETLDALRKATIQRIVTRGLVEYPKLKQTGNSWLEEIPAGWDLKMLKRVCEVQTGLTLGKTYEGPLIERPYLRVANVQDGYLDLDNVSMIEVPSAVAERVTLQVGDVLMTEGGDLDKLARGYVWSGEIDFCLHQNHIFAVRCLPHKLLPKFLAYVTASQYGRDYFEATGKRTTNLASTNGIKVGALPIPLPSLNEQKVLVEYLDSEIERIMGIQTLLHKQIDTLTAYRKSLIHECVTGQRRIGEADIAWLETHAR